jgi:hypothetical protein
MGPRPLEVELLPGTTADLRTVEQQTIALAKELRAVRGVTVDRARAAPPEGAKAFDVAAIGELLMTVGGAGGALTALVGVLRSWVTRESGRKIRVRVGEREFEMTGASRNEEQELIRLFATSVESD